MELDNFEAFLIDEKWNNLAITVSYSERVLAEYTQIFCHCIKLKLQMCMKIFMYPH